MGQTPVVARGAAFSPYPRHASRACHHRPQVLASILLLNGSMYMLRPEDSQGQPVRHADPQLASTLREMFALVSETSHLELHPLQPKPAALSPSWLS